MRPLCSSLQQDFLYFGLLCGLCSMSVSATCYYPNGTADDSTQYLPCQTTGQSMCCKTNTSIVPANTIDVCNPDGLCIPPLNSGIWRDLCTDPTWKDPACINLCTTGMSVDGGNYENNANTVPMTMCGDGSICCGNSTGKPGQACCSNHKGLFLQDGKVVTATTAAATASATSPALASAIAAASSSSPTSSPAPPSSSSNTGAIVGGVVGGIAAIVFLAFAFWYFMIRRNMRQTREQPAQNYEAYQSNVHQNGKPPGEMHQHPNGPYTNGVARNELDAVQAHAVTPELQAWHGNEK